MLKHYNFPSVELGARTHPQIPVYRPPTAIEEQWHESQEVQNGVSLMDFPLLLLDLLLLGLHASSCLASRPVREK